MAFRYHLENKGNTLLACFLGSLLVAGFLILIAPSAEAEDVTWDWAKLGTVNRWPSSGGGSSTEVLLDFSPDGTKLIVSGHIQSNSLRIMDRNMIFVSDLFRPEHVERVKGVLWSQNGTWVVAWGSSTGEGGDFLVAWDGGSYEPVDEPFINATGSIRTMYAVLFMESDGYLVISGRDEEDVSRVLVIETMSGRMVQDREWEDNASVSSLASDGDLLFCIDERGTITSIGIENWSTIQVLEGRPAEPTAYSFSPSAEVPWIIGYDDGWIDFFGGRTVERSGEAFVSENGPVQGVAWAFNELDGYYVLATPKDVARYGSWLSLFYFKNSTETRVDMPDFALDPYATVTTLLSDPIGPGLIWAGFSDGSVGQYKVEFMGDEPPIVTIDYPGDGSVHNGSFNVGGKYSDDHEDNHYLNDIEYIKLRIDDGPWVGVQSGYEYHEWSCHIDVADMTSGKHVITVEAYDGRQISQTQILFYVPGEEGSSLPWSAYLFPTSAICMVALIIIVLQFERRKRRESHEI